MGKEPDDAARNIGGQKAWRTPSSLRSIWTPPPGASAVGPPNNTH